MTAKRFFEIIPGAISWTLLFGVVIFSALQPIHAAVLVILFNLFWLVRMLYLTALLVVSYWALDQEKATNWLMRCSDILNINEAIKSAEARRAQIKRRIKRIIRPESQIKLNRKLRSESFYIKQLKTLRENHVASLDFRKLYQLVILPNYKESLDVLRSSLEALSQTHFPLDRIIVVLACEEREGESAKEKARILKKEFSGTFESFLVTFHPSDTKGEEAVKGANATWAAKQAKTYIENREIPFAQVLVSCFDADTRVSSQYFGCLAYNFLIRPDGARCSFQPIPVYHNNVWHAPVFARMLETGSSFFQLIESTNPDHLVTFSSHSMNFESLVNVNYWPIDMISDDSAIFWRCFLHYKSKYRTVPIYVTLSMNVVVGRNWIDTFRRLYVQKRRWAWGIENFPLVAEGFMKDKDIRWWEKMMHSFKMLENHVSWATWGLIVTVFGWLPILFGGREYGISVVSYNLPKMTQLIFNLASVSLVITTLLSFLLLPRIPSHVSRIKQIVSSLLQCFLLPVVLPTLLALPALDAQTRLMLGRKLHFAVSAKVVRDES